MSTITFDTHVYVKKLKAAGFTEQQAEVQAETFTEIIENRIATRQDLKELETILRRDTKELETNLTRDIKELEMRLTIRLGGIVAVGIAVVATLVKLL